MTRDYVYEEKARLLPSNIRQSTEINASAEVPIAPQKPEVEYSLAKELQIIALMVIVVVLGSLNRVANKIMTQPLGNYSFFLTLFNGIAYVFLYYGILFGRYYLGYVPRPMMSWPWRRPLPRLDEKHGCWSRLPPIKYFVIIGFLESLSNIMGTIATPYVAGPVLSLVSQTIVIFSLIAAVVILKSRYSIWQIISVGIVFSGAAVAIVPELINNQKSSSLWFALLYSMSTLPTAISFTLKEKIFNVQKGLELFVVNSTGSLFQLLWWPFMIPLTVILHQTNDVPLPKYIVQGMWCFIGKTPVGDTKHDCSPNPIPYLAYIGINLGFNILLLLLLKRASALQGFMAVKAIVPLSVLLFLIPWPLIGASTIDIYTIISLVIVILGLAMYRYTSYLRAMEMQRRKASY